MNDGTLSSSSVGFSLDTYLEEKNLKEKKNNQDNWNPQTDTVTHLLE